MKFALVYAASAALTPSLAAAAIPRDFFNRCGSLVRDFKPAPFVRVELSEALAKGTPFVSPDTHPSCLRHVPKTYTSDVCRLRFIISTSGSSSTTVEVLMPVDWKGQRFLMTGNAGLGGCVPYHSMIDAAALGFATVGHDNGHQGDTAEPFLNRPEVVKDYVYRSLQSATTVGKVAVAYFYKGAARKSYYMGCSTGGRQGMKAAQDFPEEFDGIISGAPAINLNNLFSDQGRHRKNMGAPGSPTFVSVEQWAAVNELVIKQCDHIDGVLDGVVEDPFKCTPRPERMLCRQGQTWTSHKCLTSAQVSAVRRAYEPFYNSTGGIIYPRLVPSSERQAFRNNSTTTEYMWDWFRYAVYNNPNWSPDDFSISTAEYSNKVDLYGASTWKDLTALKAQGTKLLMYHGLQDGLISAESSYQYYEHVSRSMSLPSSDLDSFFRFFPIPGHGHCYGGDGAWWVGAGTYVPPGAETALPADNGVLMSMVRWVEQGIAPERIRGVGVKPDGKVVEKDHCKWPLQNVYKGGDADKKESWSCQ